MATPSNDREKFAEKLLKQWEQIDNEMLVKEVATKGKYINLLLQFLVKRTGKSPAEVRQLFNDEIDRYIHRLLTNQQVHKAELVLKNVGRKPQALFYEFVQSTSQEHIDDGAKDHVLEHLQSCDKNFDAVREEYDYYLLVLRLVASNKLLRRQFEDDIHVFTLESLLRKSVEFRQLMACTTCLYCKNAILVEKLDKHITWTFLWQSKQYEFIVKWLNLLYTSKYPDPHHEIDSNPKVPCFDIALKNLFSAWDIEPDMFASVENRTDLDERILNSFAQNGMIVSAETDSIITILQRIFTTGSFVANSSWAISDENLLKIMRIIIEQNQIVLLLNEIFRIDLIESVLAQCKNDDIQLCLHFHNEDFASGRSIAVVSQNCSEYIIKTCDTFFYAKFPHIYFMEQLLLDVSPMILAHSDKSLQLLEKISTIELFLHKLRSTKTVTDYETTLDGMLELKNIDLNVIKQEIFTSTMDSSVSAHDDLLSFKNHLLNSKYGQETVLSYLDFVKQYRSAYAVYKFFIDQLDTYSQVSQAQIQIACGAVCEMAINNLDNVNLVAHCVAFNEMLGMNSQTLRAYIKCCQIVKDNSGDSFNLSGCFQPYEVSQQIEDIILKQIHVAGSSISSSSSERANTLWDVPNIRALKILCRARNSDLPISFLKEAAARTNWFEFLLFAAFHNYSIRSIVDVCQMDCFKDRNVGLNIGRSLKELIVEDEMPQRTESFSYREHRRKIQTRSDATTMLNYGHKLMSTSINYLEKLPPTKLHSCQQFLNINDDMDIFAVILICTCEIQLPNEPKLNLNLLRELMKCPDVDQSNTALNLIRYAFKMQWPILSVLAATIDESIIDYCWIIWLIICTELATIPDEIASFAELAHFIITYTVQENYVRTLHQSFEIFYPASKFITFSKFLSESSRHQFTAELSALLMDFLYEIDEGIVVINDSLPLSAEEMSHFITTLLIEFIRRGFDSMEHQQQLLDTIAASGIANHVECIDFITIAAINRILQFTNVRLNVDAMIYRQRNETNCTSNKNEQLNAEMMESNALQNEYNRISDELIADKAFDNALELADLLNLSKDMIIYEQWIYNFETDHQFDFDAYDRTIDQHSISPLVLINFLIFVADQLDCMDIQKYLVLKKILNAIKRHHLHPNEAIPRDRIELEMYKCVLKIEMPIDDIEMYYSDYYERCMLLERRVLYKSFLDLKDLAGVDRLTMVAREPLKKPELDRLSQLMNRLLADGDIVQAIRLHGIFDYRTIDLHYLVFAMALAEGLAHLNDLSSEQKQMLNDGTKQTMAPKFNRRTVRLKRTNTSDSTSASSSPASKTFFDSVDMNRVDFEEFPPNEKQDVLDAIQNIASRVQSGFKLSQRIAMVFRAAMHLEKEYTDVLQTKDAYILLQNTIDDPCVNRLLVMSDIILSMEMTPTEIANFVAEQVSRAIIKSRFYLLHTSVLHSFGQNFLWDYDLDRDFHLFLELCPSSSLLGHNLLKYCDTLKVYRQLDAAKSAEIDFNDQSVYADELREILNNCSIIMENQVLSYKKQNTITVELLIKAHDCFVHECSMEGIAFVLQRCKALASVLSAAKSWRLIVKLLMGVGRYRDMYYCFEILLKNGQFESLLGQFDEERCNGFKDAIISYLHEYHSDDKDNYRLVALHFQMFHELAQISESDAKHIIDTELRKYEKKMDDEISVASMNLIKPPLTDQLDGDASGSSMAINTSTLTIDGNLSSAIASGVNFLVCSKHLVESLSTAMDYYANAAENYLLDNKLSLAQRAASNAELVAMQIHLIRHALENEKTNCMCVLNIRSEHIFRHLVINELNIPQALILSRAYPFEISWTESIFNQYVIQGKGDYIIEYCVRMELSDDMIEHLVKNFIQMQQNMTPKMEKAISTIIEMVQSVTLRYKLASLLGDKRTIATMINGDCLYYLRDTTYGRNESL